MGDFNSRTEAIKATTKEDKRDEKFLSFKAIEDGRFDILSMTDHLYNDCFGLEEKSFKYYIDLENKDVE